MEATLPSTLRRSRPFEKQPAKGLNHPRSALTGRPPDLTVTITFSSAPWVHPDPGGFVLHSGERKGITLRQERQTSTETLGWPSARQP